MLEYHVVENPLSPAPDDAMAQVVNSRSYSQDELVELMLRRGTSQSRADIVAVLELFGEVVADVVAEGSSVNTPLLHLTPSIAGVFKGLADKYDAARHTIKVNMRIGSVLRSAITRIRTVKVQVPEPLPTIEEVTDKTSGSVNELLTPNGVIELRGSRLKMILEEDTNGIFLLPGNASEIKLLPVIENVPSRLMAMLPAVLASGEYRLEVRTNFARGRNERGATLKVGRFSKTLTVV